MSTEPTIGNGRRRPFAVRVWGNPLARAADQAEAVLILGLVVVWLLSLPLIATMASVEWTRVETRLAADRITDLPRDALLTEDAAPPVASHDAVQVNSTAAATWAGRDSRPTSGQIQVPPAAQAGDHIAIWIDATGAVVARPMNTSTAAALTVMAAIGVWVGLGLVLSGIWWIARRRLDRHRWDQWERDWTAFEPGRNAS